MYFGVTIVKLFTYKRDRTIKDIKSELAQAIMKVKEPSVRSSLINIVKIEATAKLSFIRVYISTIKGLAIARKACDGLQHASGFIKKELSKNLRLRYMPQFMFIATDSIEYGTNISELLNNVISKTKIK